MVDFSSCKSSALTEISVILGVEIPLILIYINYNVVVLIKIGFRIISLRKNMLKNIV